MPAIYEDENDYIIIGNIVERNFVHRTRIGAWEEGIRIPKACFENVETVNPASPDHLAALRKCVTEDIL
jgi:hypothetical protein